MLLIGVLGGAGGIFIQLAIRELVAPPRRELQAYHAEWLDHPGSHGITIHRVACRDGRVPCLIAAPDPQAGCAERGKIIREQLAGEGILLPDFGTVSGNLVLLHGRHGRKEDLLPIAERFCAVGFRCFLPDLPAHGESPLRTVTFGSTEFDRALPGAVLQEGSRAVGGAELPAALWGMSMGGAYATSTASLEPGKWRSLVIVSSFDSLDGLIGEQAAKRFGPVGPLLATAVRGIARQRYQLDPTVVRPDLRAREVSIPVLVVHGTADPLIEMTRGRLLFESFASSEKKWIEVEDGTHDNVLVTPMPLYATMAAWMIRHGSERTH